MSFPPGPFSSPFLIYPLTTKLKRSKKWPDFIQMFMIPQYPQGHRLTHVLSMNVLRDPVGKAISSPFYSGKNWGSERVATCLTSRAPALRRKVAPGHPWSRTPHSLGPGGTPELYLRDSGTPSPKAGKRRLECGSLCLPTGRSRPPPPAGPHTLSRVPNTWRLNLWCSRVMRLRRKIVTVTIVTSGFHGNGDTQASPPHPEMPFHPPSPPWTSVKAEHISFGCQQKKRTN